jgi:N6-adenosine-specific RNA methylase IME4
MNSPTTSTKYRVIVADPPYDFSDKLTMSDVKRGAESHYSTLTVHELAKLPVQQLVAEDAVLVLWCPASLITEGLHIMKSWGADYKQLWVWIKMTKKPKWQLLLEAIAERSMPKLIASLPLAFGMGHLARAAKEVAIVGIYGSPYKYVKNKSVRDVFFAESLKHSAKPECVQDALDSMFPDEPKLEIFARRSRNLWTCIGNESPNTRDEDIRDTLKNWLNHD